MKCPIILEEKSICAPESNQKIIYYEISCYKSFYLWYLFIYCGMHVNACGWTVKQQQNRSNISDRNEHTDTEVEKGKNTQKNSKDKLKRKCIS